jgi:hypothetical protein
VAARIADVAAELLQRALAIEETLPEPEARGRRDWRELGRAQGLRSAAEQLLVWRADANLLRARAWLMSFEIECTWLTDILMGELAQVSPDDRPAAVAHAAQAAGRGRGAREALELVESVATAQAAG